MHMSTGHLDALISRRARAHPPGKASLAIAKLSQPSAVTLQGIAAAIALRAAGRPALPAALAAPLACAGEKAIKAFARRRRPGLKRFEKKGHQSFPSSHVGGPFALLAAVAFAAPRTPVWRALLALGGGAALVVGVERVRAGAHWPSDVIAGIGFGALVGAALGSFARARREESRAREAEDLGRIPSP
jgi:membrane-associated phospholipid phosphatase